jgi:thiamine-phosphate pyrophosphorylase
MRSVLRIIDANANRAREALRVMEEAARFLLDDAPITRLAKTLRHDLASALISIPSCGDMLLTRDTPGDRGTAITTAGEQHRASSLDVTRAAGKRLSEALRSIEEYAKTIPEQGGKLASQIESIRYRGYELERQLDQAMTAGRASQWRLCVLVSESLCPEKNWRQVVRGAIAGGADCLQLREKTLDAGELYKRACELVSLAGPHGVCVIINDRPDIAMMSGAQGVHLGQDDLPCAQVRQHFGSALLIGVSTSRLDQARQAQRDGADYCGVGPMFPTTTKHKDVIVGETYLREYLAWNRLPHLAIGGITAHNLPSLVQAGVQGVAVSAAVCQAPDPQAAVASLIKLLGS